jgi:hypothetical protein
VESVYIVLEMDNGQNRVLVSSNLKLKRYNYKMLDAYKCMFGKKPHIYSSPLKKNNHPELDDTKELEASEITKYLSMIGALQWSISLGQFDTHTSHVYG